MERIVITRDEQGRLDVQTENCDGDTVTHLLELAKHTFLANNSQLLGAASKPTER